MFNFNIIKTFFNMQINNENLNSFSKLLNIKQYKNGSTIQIKKQNRGSFTRWCGGNVTEERIQRGKNSPNPKIRKKATFADNARHFKHKYQIGGYIQSSNIYNSLPQTLFDMFDSVDRRLRITDRYIPREFNMGTAPTPGKPKNPGKLVTKIKGTTNAKVTPSERYIDRKTFSKKIRVQDKNARAMETEKASPVNSGQSRISNAQLKEDWETMKNYSEFKNKVNRIDVKMSKYQKGTDAYKQALKDKKSLVQEYRQKYRF